MRCACQVAELLAEEQARLAGDGPLQLAAPWQRWRRRRADLAAARKVRPCLSAPAGGAWSEEQVD